MFFIKIHRSYRDVLAVCDSDLIGKTFEEPIKGSKEGRIKQLVVRESFFKDEEVSEEELITTMQNLKKEDCTFNIVGPKSIKAAIKAGIITEKNVGHVHGVPFALVLV